MIMSFFGSMFFIIFAMSCLVKEIVERQLLVLLKEPVESLLVLLTTVHFLPKTLLNISGFSLKSVV